MTPHLGKVLIAPLRLTPLALGAVLAMGAAAHATDHHNLEAGQPLQVQDAETIAAGALEWSVAGQFSRFRDQSRTGLAAEFNYGFARNWQLSVGVEPGYVRQNGDGEWTLGPTELGVAHNMRRETARGPALGWELELALPTDRGERATELHWRGLASRQAGRYGRLHANLDLSYKTHASAAERNFLPAFWLGYSRPLGLPRHFDTTFVAQAGVRASEVEGGKALANLGLGIRRQVTPRAVISAGVSRDLGGSAQERERVRLTVGYTSTF